MAEPRAFPHLANGGWRGLSFESFKPGITICRLTEDAEGEPAVAVLRYEAGAAAPFHEHLGLETVFVLDGSQRDEKGVYGVGALVLNPTGTRHSVWSDEGCVVLIQWDRPIRIINGHE
jgi:anti-sigma factor ChrR (cupin superfamily)